MHRVLIATAAVLHATVAYDIMAIYFGDWHPDPAMEAFHGQGWTEWNLVVNAQPRYPGHRQPNIPLTAPGFGLSADETNPIDMEQKVIAARNHGVDVFLFDWYWYAEQGPAGGLFLDDALEKGFLPLQNNHGMQFAIMWANQDWVDIHPAKKVPTWDCFVRVTPDAQGWAGTYRSVSFAADGTATVDAPPGGDRELLLFDGFMNASVYQAGFAHAIEHYFVQPNYYRVPTKLANGTTALCGYLAMYQIEITAAGVGGMSQLAELVANVRAMALAAGTCLHLAVMASGNPATFDPYISAINPDSFTTYCGMKVAGMPTFPESDILAYTDSMVAAWGAFRDHFAAHDLAFAPASSVAWDSSPRTLVMDSFENIGYPWGAAVHSDNSTLPLVFQKAKQYMDALCAGKSATQPGAAWCPPLLVNAWNEWSEGAFLEPDVFNQWGRLQALNSTFASRTRPADHGTVRD